MSWSEIAIDKAASVLVESTAVGASAVMERAHPVPPQELLDKLENAGNLEEFGKIYKQLAKNCKCFVRNWKGTMRYLGSLPGTVAGLDPSDQVPEWLIIHAAHGLFQYGPEILAGYEDPADFEPDVQKAPLSKYHKKFIELAKAFFARIT